MLRGRGQPDDAEAWIREALARKERIMGFGHRVYKTGDVRRRHPQGVRPQGGGGGRGTCTGRRRPRSSKHPGEEKHLFPNLDWPAGRLYHALGLEIPLYTPIFVMARVTGWSAHFIEQQEHNRLIRPRSRYTGPERDTSGRWRSVAERG